MTNNPALSFPRSAWECIHPINTPMPERMSQKVLNADSYHCRLSRAGGNPPRTVDPRLRGKDGWVFLVPTLCVGMHTPDQHAHARAWERVQAAQMKQPSGNINAFD
ncbi:hypothetical protein [Endozoicomonas sp.]|uniref:hypothetical protein n=1 Tax=Endozoicomonas sp. TaxID=1892382 RepID=UPI00383BCB3B